MLEAVQMRVDRPLRARSGGSWTEGLREMRQTRIEKPRRSVRVRRDPGETYGLSDLLDFRDPDIVRAKRLRSAPRGGTPRP